MSTAFPQPAPGSASAPGPMKVPGERLRSVLGVTNVQHLAKEHRLAVVDSPLAKS
jgi:3',5'-cyclic-AMP phosphodiesterase